jgi:hypothetical protein
MQPNTEPVRKRTLLPNITHVQLVQSRLRRYPPPFRLHVHTLANRHPRLADLAVSFPALLFALAAPRPGFDPAPAIARAIDGACLADLALSADIPMWLRKLPPEAFVRRIGIMPDDELFRRRIANHLPGSAKLASAWLHAVADAADWGHELLAVWIARESASATNAVKIDRLRAMSLYAWFSGRPGTRAHELIGRAWNPGMRFKSALDAATTWWTKVDLHLNLGDAPITDMWLHPGSVAGYEFIPIRSVADIMEEAAIMENCLTSYGPLLAHKQSRLFSVRRDGRRVATLKVALTRRDDPLLNVAELRSVRNKEVSSEVWLAARRWLHLHDLARLDTKRPRWDEAPLHSATWKSMWRPYWLAKRRIPDWLPLRPSRAVLRQL